MPLEVTKGSITLDFAEKCAGAPVETIENFAEGQLADEASYTPASPGIFLGGKNEKHWVLYYSDTMATWYRPAATLTANYVQAYTAIGDGTNFKIQCKVGPADYLLMRHHLPSATYERDYDDGDLAFGTAWTPATAGFRAIGAESTYYPSAQLDFPNDGWDTITEYRITGSPLTIMIGDGVDWRVYNGSPDTDYAFVCMRVVMT